MHGALDATILLLCLAPTVNTTGAPKSSFSCLFPLPFTDLESVRRFSQRPKCKGCEASITDRRSAARSLAPNKS
uniref:Secreted protein n=1 Tax=Oryzias sinensis TaxID=183150 RepID=A0A8C8DX35_9TELE